MKVPNLNRSGLDSGRTSLTLRGLAFSLGLLTNLGVLAAEVGEKAPSFSIVSLTSNETVSLDDFKGKVVILDFWASWCGPCMQEIPRVNAVVDAYGEDVAVLGVNMGEDARTVERAVEARGMRYPSVLDPRSALGTKFAVQSIPLVVVLDATGRIRYRGNGLPTRSTALIDGLLSSS